MKKTPDEVGAGEPPRCPRRHVRPVCRATPVPRRFMAVIGRLPGSANPRRVPPPSPVWGVVGHRFRTANPRMGWPFPCKRTAAKIVNWLQSSQIGVRPCAMLLTLARGRQQRLPTAQLVLAAAIALWTVLMIVLGQGDLAARGPVTRGTMETVVAFAALFGALVMLLFPRQAAGRRLWWLAAALIVIGVSAIAFGASRQFTDSNEPASAAAYAWLSTRFVASLFLCFAVAGAPPAARRRRAVVVLALLGAAWCSAVELAAPLLPVLT